MLKHEAIILGKDDDKEPLSDISMTSDQGSHEKKRKYEHHAPQKSLVDEFFDIKRDCKRKESERIDKLTEDITDIKKILVKLVKDNDD